MDTEKKQYYNYSQQLWHLILRTPKKDSAFLYFLFESHEGICMYSTIDDSKHLPYRDIDVKATLEFQSDLMNLINLHKHSLSIEIIHEATIADGKKIGK